MKIVRIDGGLGNQMFCYAFALALHQASRQEVLIDSHRYKYFPNHNGYELDQLFDIELKEASRKQLWSVTYPAYSLLASRIYQRFPQRKSEIVENFTKCYPQIISQAPEGYYIGNWQWYKYFDDIKHIICKAFTFVNPLDDKNRDLYNMLKDCNSVSLHIRRGDYLNTPLYCGICELDYYVNAINRVKEIIGAIDCYAVFSNDTEWCNKHILPLTGDTNTMVIDWNQGIASHNDMRLMSACRGNIIANSSFSWWAAYLNEHKDKIVISPDKWINLELDYRIQCDEWICI